MRYKTIYILILIALVAISSISWIAFRQDDTESQVQSCQIVMKIDRLQCLYLIENHTYVVVKEPTIEKDN